MFAMARNDIHFGRCTMHLLQENAPYESLPADGARRPIQLQIRLRIPYSGIEASNQLANIGDCGTMLR